mmetsp:Transcript_1380/g.1345  ORF Transcript_1380/g.1345 Transcript_1380/m.1345 type:complete len:130 (-) Transcript_1380:137-526(-)
MGFANDMDFFYMPMDIVKSRNLRYAFINFVSETVAARFIDLFSGYRFDDDNNSYYRGSAGSSSKVCEISPARVQGFYPNVDHFQRDKRTVVVGLMITVDDDDDHHHTLQKRAHGTSLAPHYYYTNPWRV